MTRPITITRSFIVTRSNKLQLSDPTSYSYPVQPVTVTRFNHLQILVSTIYNYLNKSIRVTQSNQLQLSDPTNHLQLLETSSYIYPHGPITLIRTLATATAGHRWPPPLLNCLVNKPLSSSVAGLLSPSLAPTQLQPTQPRATAVYRPPPLPNRHVKEPLPYPLASLLSPSLAPTGSSLPNPLPPPATPAPSLRRPAQPAHKP
ncbi:unnamed protein product [Cuscuta epithymum]|uniref:Uncharacterized protein n=1 Tax=Cuscuta epithymum TaxID=186058 RepID=A0AAV0BZJ5_9ASTE|nr:unnamed protein product [Cuscuta epithymum]